MRMSAERCITMWFKSSREFEVKSRGRLVIDEPALNNASPSPPYVLTWLPPTFTYGSVQGDWIHIYTLCLNTHYSRCIQNRWLLVELLPVGTNSANGHLDGKQIWSALKQSVLSNFGDIGWGTVGLSLTGTLLEFYH